MNKSLLSFTKIFSFLPSNAIAPLHDDEPVVVVEDDWLLITATTPAHVFKSAHQSFIKRDWQASAAAVRRAGAYIAAEAARAGSANEVALHQTAQELKAMADRIKVSSVSDIHAIEALFAAAQLNLAAHYHGLARRAHAAEHNTHAGRYMHRAAESLREAAEWSGNKLEGGAADAVGAATAAGDTLEQGGKWVVEKNDDLMADLENSIVSLGRSLHADAGRKRAASDTTS